MNNVTEHDVMKKLTEEETDAMAETEYRQTYCVLEKKFWDELVEWRMQALERGAKT